MKGVGGGVNWVGPGDMGWVGDDDDDDGGGGDGGGSDDGDGGRIKTK